jgi:hypothetical protein
MKQQDIVYNYSSDSAEVEGAGAKYFLKPLFLGKIFVKLRTQGEGVLLGAIQILYT